MSHGQSLKARIERLFAAGEARAAEPDPETDTRLELEAWLR